jgi:hypothetical protein
MDLVGTSITGVIALLGVLLGGWLSLRNQDRLWQRDHARQWRDIRLAAYKDVVVATRAYVTYAAEPSAGVTAVPQNGWTLPQRQSAWYPSPLGPSVPPERWWAAPGKSLLHEQPIRIQNCPWRTS